MTTALSVDSLPLKWPFGGALEPVSPAHGQPARARRVTPAPSAQADAQADNAELQLALQSVAGVQHASASASPMTRFGVSRRQAVGDVALVLVWAAIIPAMLWFGHAAGF